MMSALGNNYNTPPTLRPRKSTVDHCCRFNLISIYVAAAAVSRLRNLLTGPTPQLIRIGVRNKGCAGLSYHFKYIDKPGKFDEVVTQDSVRVLLVIDGKALFSIIRSEMDWKEDQLRCDVIFRNK